MVGAYVSPRLVSLNVFQLTPKSERRISITVTDLMPLEGHSLQSADRRRHRGF